jgi:hypothetical protein
MALGTAGLVAVVLALALLSASAALTGAENISAQAAANAVRVANVGALVALLDKLDWLMAFIKVVTLFIKSLFTID